MRTTITFDDDTAAVVEQLRRERGDGVSAVVNELIRRAVGRPAPERAVFTHLLCAEDASSPHHEPCRRWLEAALNGDVRVGLPWPSADTSWIPAPTDRHAAVLGDLLRRHHLSAGLVPDAHLAALAIEHGVGVCSADTDFARFTGLRWTNPLP